MAPVLNSMAAAKSSSSNKDEQNHSSSSSRKAAAAARPSSQEEAAAALKCPRCDSPNTKFCYFNNYSLTQPRHFCKTCRRYWTKGGALRNVPIGGGCRKNKKTKSSSSSSSSSRLISNLESKDINTNHLLSSTDIGGLKFFHGLTPAMDFQLGGLNIPRLHSSSPTTGGLYNNQFSSFGDMAATTTTTCGFSLDPSGIRSSSSSPNLMGFNFPFSSMLKVQGENGVPPGGGGEVLQEMGSLNHHHHTSLASSIESLSSINQDLHWKLQQQRLAMLFGGENNNNQKESNTASIPLGVGSEVQQQHQQPQKPQPILFHNLEMSTPRSGAGHEDNSSRREGSSITGNLSTEWFFDSSYAPVTPTPTNSNSNGNGNHDHHQNISNWNGIQAWSQMSQYNEL